MLWRKNLQKLGRQVNIDFDSEGYSENEETNDASSPVRSSASGATHEPEEPMVSVRMKDSDKSNYIPKKDDLFLLYRSSSEAWTVFRKVKGQEGWSWCTACGKADSWYRDHGSTTSLKSHANRQHQSLVDTDMRTNLLQHLTETFAHQ
jgi:hypothetical protein